MLGVSAAGELRGIGRLTPHGLEVWSQLQPARLPAWTGPDHDLQLDIGADLGAMAGLVRSPEQGGSRLGELERDCGRPCTFPQLVGAPAQTFLVNLGWTEGVHTVGLRARWTAARDDADLHIMTRSDAVGEPDADPTVQAIEALFRQGQPTRATRRGALLVETGEPSSWGRARTIPAGMVLTVPEPSAGPTANGRNARLLRRLPVDLDWPLRVELVRRGGYLLLTGNGASLPEVDAREPLGRPWTDEASYRCLRDLVARDPVAQRLGASEPWLSDEVPSQVASALARAETCRAVTPDQTWLIEHQVAGVNTLLGLYLQQHARYDEARAPLQAACTSGDWLACEAASALPAPGVRLEQLPEGPPGLEPPSPTAPVLALGDGRVSAGAGSCALGDRDCLADLIGAATPLLLVAPGTTVGEVATLLGTIPSRGTSPALWLAGRDGARLGSRQVGLDLNAAAVLEAGGDVAKRAPDTVVVSASLPAGELLRLGSDPRALWFALQPEAPASRRPWR